MIIRDIMNERVARVSPDAQMSDVAELLVLTQASDIVVVDDQGGFVGVVSEGDIIRAAMPNFEELLASQGSLSDAFQIFLQSGQELATSSISRLILTNPMVVKPQDELLAAAAAMIEHNIRRLPVVDENSRFCGTVSRADICWALMRKQSNSQ